MSANLKERAYRHIRQELALGRWNPERLLSKRKLASQMGMSYTPIREALVQLETEGLIEKVDNLGVRVRQLGREEIRHVYQLRTVLESGAVKLAAEQITDVELNTLRENLRNHLACLKRIRDTGRGLSDFELYQKVVKEPFGLAILKLNTEFHLAIIQSIRNPQLTKIVKDLHFLPNSLRMIMQLPSDDFFTQLFRDLESHYRIYRALKQRDGTRARDWMEKHIGDSMKHHLDACELMNQLIANERRTYEHSESTGHSDPMS
jgi:DNA-binding GntR family transcriptional regulator